MTSSCVNSGADQLLIPPGGGGSFMRSGGGTNDSTLVGTFYYISTHNGSTDLVTDSRGKVIARFAYDPFGNIVNELTDLDPDGNREFYKGTFYFTGQEYEVETGLYNYKARLYDSKTGRFLQPDPVHTDASGMDNFDRYQYVWNNPVNYVDPDGKRACSKQVLTGVAVMAGAGLGAVLGGPYGAVGGGLLFGAAFGVAGNYTGGGGNCSTRLPKEKEALFLVLWPYLPNGTFNDLAASTFLYLHYYENYVKGNGPSFLGKLNNADLQFFLLGQLNLAQNNSDPGDDMFPVAAYFLMRDTVANPRSGVDMASFFHDQFGPNVFKRKNRKANSRWISQANRATFSHDSWSRTYKREYNATPEWWGDARSTVATINSIGTWTADAIMTVTGTVLFGFANLTTGTKNWDKPDKWRL
jgi:RHS repeat-associated protein